MCRKFIVLVSVAVLTGFLLTSSANADPNLLGWWRLDEGTGTTTADSSALGNDGTFGVDYNDLPDTNNAPQWVGGRRGERALQFNRLDGADFVTCGNDQKFDVNGPMTVMAWVRGPLADLKMTVVAKGGDSWRLYCYNDNRLNFYYDFPDKPDANDNYSISVMCEGMNAEWGDWHHYAATVGKNEEDKWEAKVYWDGDFMEPDSGDPVDPNDSCCFAIDGNDLWIGGQDTNDSKGERYWQGLIDDVRIYDYNMTEAELQAISNEPYDIAHDPFPEDGAEAAVQLTGKVTLKWVESANAVDHNVYFGTSSPPDFVKNQDTNSYEPNSVFEAGGIDFGGTYYWQIEEDDAGTLYKSPIWSFSVPDYIIIDDFEAYGTIAKLHAVWAESGTGYVVPQMAEDEQHEDGTKAMEIQYYGVRIEADNTLDPAIDFTSDGRLKALTLYFLAAGTNNNSEELYVRLQSTDGNAVTIFHPNNPNAILPSDFWQEWNIVLPQFKQEPAGNDVNLTEVEHIVIGIGDETYDEGHTGRVIFDDVRLYPSRCIFDEGPLGDMAGNTGDCKVDKKDLGLMSDDWLSQNPGLILWYKLDDTNGYADSNIVEDSSGRGYHGTINDPNRWLPADGKIDGCVDFYEKDYIEVPLEVLSHIRDEITVAFWANGNPNDAEPDEDLCNGGECDRIKNKADVVLHAKYARDDIARVLAVYLPEPEVNNTHQSITDDYRFDAGNPDDGYDQVAVEGLDLNAEYRGKWNHYAFTKNAKTGVMTIYVNGDPNVGSSGNFAQIYGAAKWKSDETGLRIGMKLDEVEDTHWYMFGRLDDFRIYDYVLSESDIARLANTTPQEPLSVERGNFDNDPNGMVNFEDYAELGNNWLKEQLWP